jgi:16S rRNA (uracil1498-N3)-methyltransferase
MIRLYLCPSPDLTAGAIFPLPPEQSRYLTSVMRLDVGAGVSVFNGRDGEWTARIAEVAKKAVRLELLGQTRPQTTTPNLTLVIALIKRARLETIVEKATELGVTAIQPVITRRSNADHTNIDRLRLIAQEAAEQTERLDVPEVLQVVKLEKWLENNSFTALIFPDEATTREADAATMLDGLKAATPPRRRFRRHRARYSARLGGRHPRQSRPAHPARRHRRHQRPHALPGRPRRLAVEQLQNNAPVLLWNSPRPI